MVTLLTQVMGWCWVAVHEETNPHPVQAWPELDRKCTIFAVYKPCLKVLLALLCMQIKPFKYQV